MHTILGFPAMIVAFGLIVITGGALFIIGGVAVKSPILFQIGIRNIVRRPGRTLILLCGLVLSTALITASLGLNDSFASSLADSRLPQMGAVDETVTGTFQQNLADQDLALIRKRPEVAAATGLLVSQFSTDITSTKSGFTMRSLDLFALPPDFDQVFGNITTLSGRQVHFTDIQADDVMLSASVARNFDVHEGDSIEVLLGRRLYQRTVRAILSTDIAITTGELIGTGEPGPHTEIFMPLATFQQIYFEQTHIHNPVNVLCIRNVNQAGATNAASQSIISYLQQIFGGIPVLTRDHVSISDPTSFSSTLIHPLKPDVMQFMKVAPFISSSDVFSSPAALQFEVLLPLFTGLLVIAGMLLLILLILLLAAERRAELGISRALGLQRWHLIQIFLLEGCGYAIVASSLGLLFGIGMINLELFGLNFLPSPAPGPGGQAVSSGSHISLHLAVSWESLVVAWCVAVLTTLMVILFTAVRISRMPIVAAIRDLDDPAPEQTSLSTLRLDFGSRPEPGTEQLQAETLVNKFGRWSRSVVKLVAALCRQGPLLLLAGAALSWLAVSSGDSGLQQLAIPVLILCVGFLITWILSFCKVPYSIARRIGFSLVGLGWLIYGLQEGSIFTIVFIPSPQVSLSLSSALEIVLSPLLSIGGATILIITNADVLAIALGNLMDRMRALAPVSRTSLVYPVTFRFRTGVAVTLLSLITFLIMLLVSNNIGAVQQGQIKTTTGNFALQVSLNHTQSDFLVSQMSTNSTLHQNFSAIALIRPLFEPAADTEGPAKTALVMPIGQTWQITSDEPDVIDDTFLTHTTLPLLARARGYTSDQQIWAALKDHPGYVVMREDQTVSGIPTNNGFTPFPVQLPDSAKPTAQMHQVTVIGVLSRITHWPAIFMSSKTAATIVKTPVESLNTYYFQLQPGVSQLQAEQSLKTILHTDQAGVVIYSLNSDEMNQFTTVLTFFLGGYLSLGLLFGALAMGVIMNRAVIERRQQIGMLRALGFSRKLIQRSFLIEASFVITLSLLIGSALAWWLVLTISRTAYQGFLLPIEPIIVILLGSYLVAFVMTVFPARQASLLSPAEALRYE